MKLQNYAMGEWVTGSGEGRTVVDASTGEVIGAVTSDGLNFGEMMTYAREVGGPNLRKYTFHERALMLKAMAQHLLSKKEHLYELSYKTGATKTDSWIDIDGGIGTFFVYSGKGRRDLPNERFYVEGPAERISKNGTFTGRHLCVPLEGVATHINAFNFPCWGMLEKLAPNLLAGMPAIVKPATASSFLTEAMFREMIAADIFPKGSLQLICGGVGDLFEHLTEQDVVTFTGSAWTGRKLKSHPKVIENAVRFNMEADSLNCSILGLDAEPGTPEFDLFIKEVAREMTVKAGQKCTAIRRTIVPRNRVDAVIEALSKRLAKTTVGDPRHEGVRMGPLVDRSQMRDVGEKVDQLKAVAEVVFGGPGALDVQGSDPEKGAFFPPTLLYCDKPFQHSTPHDVEAFGPVSTILPYEKTEGAVNLAKLGRGSLCGSLFTADDEIAKEIILGTAAYHGRLMVVNAECAAESTGHGSPLPHLVHGGPGRAGGGEEMGGIRAVLHYMQRTAIQGSPTTLTRVCNEWTPGAKQPTDRIHPFRKTFDELEIGETLFTHRRTVTEADVVQFAGISGDFFYAHMDDIAAKESLFERRVAHGYFVISAAAGLFVDPAPGPVLANYGLENLRFIEPVYPGDTIRVKLTCQKKTAKPQREPDEVPQGVVAWAVEVVNQDEVTVATYTILTLVRRAA